QYPQHPLSYLIAAEGYWGTIFCETGHITPREIWNIAETKSSAHDEAFLRTVEQALKASETMKESEETPALGTFYAGVAHGVQARLYMLREQALKSGTEGKQMREALLDAMALDPELTPDAYLGLGVYNYYADVLSPLVKLFRFFLLIPGGDREEGIEQLQTASQQAVLLAPEAQYELARILGIRENRHPEAFTLLQALADQYPSNALYGLAAAFEAQRAGNIPKAIEYARKAKVAAEGMDDLCRARLLPAAQQALKRLAEAPAAKAAAVGPD
ncbi:MAG TPA: hypothetical protein VJ417_11360, partial [Candidatus Glassbacteria bacterium]|nr:hypothetical protein [Candidatus Glassbacteria bacterium]